MRPFTIYTAECTWNARNCQYTNEVIVQDIPTLQQAMGRDRVWNRKSSAQTTVITTVHSGRVT